MVRSTPLVLYISAIINLFRKRFLKYKSYKTPALNLSKQITVFVAFKVMATKTKYWTGICVYLGNDVPIIILIEANNYFHYLVNIKIIHSIDY